MDTGATARNARQADFIQYGGLSVSGGDYVVACWLQQIKAYGVTDFAWTLHIVIISSQTLIHFV